MGDSIKKQDIKCDIMEKLEEQVFKISRLIFKEVTGTISDEEQRYLEWWRGRNPDNERLYRELKDGQRVMGEVKQLEGVEVIRPLEGMHLRIREEERRLRQRRWQWGVAAAAVVAVFMGCFYLFPVDDRQESMPLAKAEQPIKTGGVRAVLRLEDGRVVDLETLAEGVKVGGMDAVKIDERRLSYAGQGKTEREKRKKLVYNEVEVPRGGEFDLILADGTTVWLNAGSKLRYPVEFVGKERRVFLEGEAYFSVTKDADMPFRVEILQQTVEVLGTEFNVSGYMDEAAIYTTLVTGKVKVATDSGENMVLAPGEQSMLDCRDGHLDKREVDVEKVIAWKKGMFILEEQTLEQIMQKFARWYDMEVVYRDDELKNIIFKGVVPRYTELREVLNILEKTNEVKFDIEERTVIVFK